MVKDTVPLAVTANGNQSQMTAEEMQAMGSKSLEIKSKKSSSNWNVDVTPDVGCRNVFPGSTQEQNQILKTRRINGKYDIYG